LFSESPSRIVASAVRSNVDQIIALAQTQGVPAAVIGSTGGDRLVIAIDGENIIDRPVGEVESAWRNALPRMLEVTLVAAD
jgi:phosphoribosylformylglycinamidine synthase